DRTNITVGYPQTNRKIDTGKTLTRWPVFVDHFNPNSSVLRWHMNHQPGDSAHPHDAPDGSKNL
ncbi:hypothetical protein CSW72_25575, partial [Shigella boydii]